MFGAAAQDACLCGRACMRMWAERGRARRYRCE